MYETNVTYLTQEKHPAPPQVSSEDPDSASIQEVRLLTIEAAGPTGSRDGQEACEEGMALKNAGLFRQTAEHFKKTALDPVYGLKDLGQIGLSLKKMENRKRPWRFFVAHCKCPRPHQKNK